MKILSRILFRENEVFNFFFDHLVDEQGNEVKEYFVLEPKKIRPDRVAGAAILALVGGKIGLVEIYRPALRRYCWELPHGFINENESHIAAAVRELKEETGIIVNETSCTHLGFIGPDPGIIGATLSIYYSESGRQTEDAISELGLKQVKFFDVINIIEMIDNSVIIDAITLAALLKYLSYTGRIKWDLSP